MTIPGSKISRYILRSRVRKILFHILGVSIDLSNFVWILSGSLTISPDSKTCMSGSTFLTVSLVFVFILVMMNIAKCIVQLGFLLILGLHNTFNLNNNNLNERNPNRVPLIVDHNDAYDEGGLNLSQI